ncbi:MAG: urea transporter [bacterium]
MKNTLNGILNSYGQVFFSKNIVLAIILMVISFFDLYAGIAGLLAVFISNNFASLIGLNREKISEGLYGFNSLLVGLGIGIYYQPGVEFYIILVFITLLTLFTTVLLEGVFWKYGLPFLSIPFLVGIWVVLIAAKGYSALDISERGIYQLNDMYTLGGMTMVRLYEWFNNLSIPASLRIYFKSLSAIFFQYHMFAGLLIALGLLIYSRIAFLMSLIGFFTAYYFYFFIGADISELSYSYIGFNYILTAIAVGGFFIVPSRQSVLWVILLTPLVSLILSSTAYIFSIFNLSVFSLPFNIVVIMFLYVLKLRERNKDKPASVTIQKYSPEMHVYAYNSYHRRFGNLPWFDVQLPFFGEWMVTQAHRGEHTHKDEWQHAWDFEIADEEGKVYSGSGNQLSDYYSYNKPVSAPLDGEVVAVEDGVDDNRVGEMNLVKNWGNSVVIKHDDKFFSQVSHLKADSIKVHVGQNVKQGEVVGHCGNSGRSPIPHIHFQLQENPSIGSKTLDYPISSYLVNNNGKYRFETAGVPRLRQVVSNFAAQKIIARAFRFIPGDIIDFEVDQPGGSRMIRWVVESDIHNNTSLKCEQTGAVAWFKNTGHVFYFTHYEGRKFTLLYYFFLSSYKVVSSDYPGLHIKDEYPLFVYPSRSALLLQDICIPFFKFLTAQYSMHIEKDNSGKHFSLLSQASFGNSRRTMQFRIDISDKGISKISIHDAGQAILAQRKIPDL